MKIQWIERGRKNNMQSQQNPYSTLINMIKKYGAAYNPPSIQLGEVLSDSPLLIKVGDLQLNSKNLLISDYLLKDYERKAEQKIHCSGYENICSRIEINDAPLQEITSEGSIKYTDGLKQGDLVAMLSTHDGQKFIVLSRVVRL
jgi:hypothetical protein